MNLRVHTLGVLCATLIACGERGEAQSDEAIRALADELVPAVEDAVKLRFRDPPAIGVRSRDAVQAYLEAKLKSELPPEVLEGIEVAYRLFGLMPDTLDLEALLLGLYTEQVVGYFDPDSSTLYVVEGADQAQLRMVLAHELVHALQGQYVSIGELLDPDAGNDRRSAAQAVLEGQATLVSLKAMLPDQDLDAMPELWRNFRPAIKQQYELMPVFSAAPVILQEVLIFPYLGGADFVRWFEREYPDTVPFGPRLPRSTEQILHPDRYREGDDPVELVFAEDAGALFSDELGEFETRVLLGVLTGSESMGRAGAMAWGGDQYAVFRDGEGDALVWWSVWDTGQAADRFASVLERGWATRTRPGRRHVVDRHALGGHAAVRLIDAPSAWQGWDDPPAVRVESPD
ncbi:MAG: hypothetical protein JSW43_03130 [Gemmatimonadota bacterium]|nr:MAG: hypothetical protein JSW43_03130 [Gemmatimonadota bacterium]